jgi:hypothetical protein
MSELKVALTGQIGETLPLYNQPLKGIKQLVLDMSKVSYISSVGVKAWIVWTVRIPADCLVSMVDVPYVIASQASMVLGFVNSRMKIESMRAPFLCASCGFEEIRPLKRGQDYEYATGGNPRSIKIPEKSVCSKCRATEAEPDFIQDKTFKFLDMV